MTLRAETTYEYTFRDPYLYYCKEHECFRATDSHEDSVLLAGVSQERLNAFISCYMNYVLDNQELQEYFDNAIKSENKKEYKEETYD